MSHLFFLYLHVASATVLMGGTVASRFALLSLIGAPDLATLRGALAAVQRICRFNPALAIVMLISGAVLGRVGWWSDAWFWVAVATWMANSILALRFVVPGHHVLGKAAARAGDGSVPESVAPCAARGLRHSRSIRWWVSTWVPCC